MKSLLSNTGSFTVYERPKYYREIYLGILLGCNVSLLGCCLSGIASPLQTHSFCEHKNFPKDI